MRDVFGVSMKTYVCHVAHDIINLDALVWVPNFLSEMRHSAQTLGDGPTS